MRSISSALLLLTLVVGCEHKSKKNQPPADRPAAGGAATGAGGGAAGGGGTAGTGAAAGTGQASGAAKPTDEMTPEPVAKDPGRPEVRPPVAGDLADYTTDMKGTKLKATIETTLGAFHCELYGDKTPVTVANFVGLATGKKPWLNPKTGNIEKGKPFYDGLIFHRVIPEFMIQGGDPLGQGNGGPGYDFADEFVPELTMAPGVLAMANAGPGTNGSQFFITEGSPSYLNNRHTVFGKCAELDLVKKITRVEKLCPECDPRDPRHDRPKTDVAITKVTITKE